MSFSSPSLANSVARHDTQARLLQQFPVLEVTVYVFRVGQALLHRNVQRAVKIGKSPANGYAAFYHFFLERR